MDETIDRIVSYLEDLEYDQLELFLAQEGDYDDDLQYHSEED